MLGGDEHARARSLVVQALEREDPLQGGDAARAELRSRGMTKLVERLRGGPRGAVDAGGEHRVECVGDVDYPRAERDLLPLEAVRVAGAVEALVMVPDRRDGVVQEAEAVDDARAFVGVAL